MLTLLLTAGCSSDDPRFQDDTLYIGGFRGRPPEVGRANFDNISYWDGDGVPGAPSIQISLDEQKAFFYKGGELVGVSAISAGREGFSTPAGHYKIIQKNRHHKSNLYGDYVDPVTGAVVEKDIGVRSDPKPPGTVFDGASMPYFMRIVGGVGMHEGFLPGYPASHGCIRLPGFMAKAFFHHVEIGTPVTVTP
ncbi:MAG: L,D-transpeptidase family protein [Verrucomicrobiota bacterium]|nr:L,D-transpeptidase family protein [Verrucomicrobiota bacterium]